MKSEHTPGALRAAREIRMVVDVKRYEVLHIGTTLYEARIKELAHIIDEETAAPELLEAAERVNRLYGNLFDTTDGGGFVHPDTLPEYDAAFESLGAAIAKAKDGNTDKKMPPRSPAK